MNKLDSINPKIEILPEHIIDQIKAGEVLERPASLVKELIENSLDAGSTEINLHIVENGLELLSIEDNGHGMTFENLPYAFLRHATSKLKTFDDLFHLYSFGFRGEALASVAASSRLTCTTQPRNLALPGGKLISHGGAQELLIPYQSNQSGTSLYIKDLFYNTPARLKFIKSKSSEKSSLKKMLYSFVLSNPQTTFTIKWDEKEKEVFKSDEKTEKRIEQVFISKSQNNELWQASEEYENNKVEVFFTPTTHSTPQFRHHYLFANRRFFQDKSIHSAVLRTLEPLWRYGESGHYAVMISTPPEEIDVNVHPNKTQIKFLKMDVIYSLLVTSLKSAQKAHVKHTDHQSIQSSHEEVNFFSKQENQHFDLLNLTNPQNESLAIPLPIQPGFATGPLIGMISNHYLLLNKNNQFFIADLRKIMAVHLESAFNLYLKSEELAGPLLISEPFKIPKGFIDDRLEELKGLGFDIDRLNSEVLALRTLPRFIPQVLAKDVTLSLIHFFNQNKSIVFSTSAFKTYLEIHWPINNPIPLHLLNKILIDPIVQSSGVLIELNEKILKAILK